MPTHLILTLLLGSVLSTQAIEPWKTLKLWPKNAPGEQGDIGPEAPRPVRPGQKKVIRIGNVSVPTLSIFKPMKPNGAAVVICPGGGYSILAWDLEGTEVAQWLNGIGVTALVLKYRVPRRKNRPKHEAPLQDAPQCQGLGDRSQAHWHPWFLRRRPSRGDRDDKFSKANLSSRGCRRTGQLQAGLRYFGLPGISRGQPHQNQTCARSACRQKYAFNNFHPCRQRPYFRRWQCANVVGPATRRGTFGAAHLS